MKSFSVSEINRYIKRLMGTDPLLNHVIVEGEISNFNRHSSGHAYFTLKDESSKLSCVIFAGQLALLSKQPQNGEKIHAKGQISIYERDGKYQLYVQKIEYVGQGALHVQFEALKVALTKEGLFDQSHKKKLPVLPKKIALITSPTGAALHDIISVATRRSNFSDLLIYPVHVQGDKAPFEIAAAIKKINQSSLVDVIILARGGGSIEELWAFNEELVARAIFDSKIPIVTGIGHETDFTISDFVSDFRAPTPSAAAEVVIKSKSELNLELNKTMQQLYACIKKEVTTQKFFLDKYSSRQMARILKTHALEQHNKLDVFQTKLQTVLDAQMLMKKEALKSIGQQLSAYNPLDVLQRGYAMVYKDQKIITSIHQVEAKNALTVAVTDGLLHVTVDDIKPNDEKG